MIDGGTLLLASLLSAARTVALASLVLSHSLLWPADFGHVSEPSYQCQTPLVRGYLGCVFTDADGHKMNFLLLLPPGYDPSQQYPLVLMLHGGGERAVTSRTFAENLDVLARVDYNEIWTYQPDHPKTVPVEALYPTFVVVPQLNYPNNWVNVAPSHGSYTLASEPTPSLQTAKDLVDYLQMRFSGIDSNRLYLTGISIGAYGAWDALERWPDYFAAALIAAGAGDPSKAALLKSIPIWVLQGADDKAVPVSGSTDMVKAIKAAGGDPKLTLVPGAGHAIFTYVYDPSAKTNNHIAWLFSQHKSS